MASVTDLILETFRLNGELLIAGDRLVAHLDLTASRWQILGAIGMPASPLPVAQIARNMGLSRQGVQRNVNDLVAQDLLVFAPNPHHKRAKLVMLTSKGQAIFDAAMQLQRPWASSVAAGISLEEIDTAHKVLTTMRSRLQSRNDTQPLERQNVEEHP